MKKTLIAFAALTAIAGVAQAQSSVTLYGLVDAFVGQTATERNSTVVAPNGVGTVAANNRAKLKQNVVNSDGQNFSRWGLKGTEDLGNGMSAFFVLESGFSTDKGELNTAAKMFNRTAALGLKGGFGSVSLGRQYTAYDTLRGATNNIYNSNFATTNTVWKGGMADYSSRADNSIAYESPVFGGFSGGITYGFGEDKVNATTAAFGQDATSNVAAHIKYANGPLLVGYAHQEEKFQSAGFPLITTAAKTNKYDLFAGSYDFGVAKLTGGYNQAKDGTTKDKEYQIGVSVPFGAAAVAAGYSHSKSESAGNSNKGTGVSLLGTYALSKRTNLYTGFMRTKVESQNAATEEKGTTFGLGVRHLF